ALRQALPGAAAKEPPESLTHDRAEALGHRLVVRPFREELTDLRVVLVPEHDVLFGREVAEEGTRGDGCRVGDVLDRRLRVALVGEEPQRLALNHEPGPGALALAPLRRAPAPRSHLTLRSRVGCHRRRFYH